MNEVLAEGIFNQVDDIYKNMFLIALDRNIDFTVVVDEAATIVNGHKWEGKTQGQPRGFEGMVFLSALAEIMGESLGDIYFMRDTEKETILRRVVRNIDISQIRDTDYEYDEAEDATDFVVRYGDRSDLESEGQYKLQFWKRQVIGGSPIYSVELTPVNKNGEFGVCTDLMYDTAVIWKGIKGEVVSFVEEVISMMDNRTTDDYDEEEHSLSAQDKKENCIVAKDKSKLEKINKTNNSSRVTYASNEHNGFITYQGSVKNVIAGKAKCRFLKVQKPGKKIKYVQVYLNGNSKDMYIEQAIFARYREELQRLTYLDLCSTTGKAKKKIDPCVKASSSNRCSGCGKDEIYADKGMCWECYKKSWIQYTTKMKYC